MARKAAEMTSLAVKRLMDPGLHFVGGVPGLALQVLSTGGRTWILRVTIAGRRRDMGLGGYPEVTLAEARDAARRARALIRDGEDPIEKARAAKNALKAEAAKAMTFKSATDAFIKSQEAGWRNAKHRAQWNSSLERYAHPIIGNLSVSDLDTPHVLKVIDPIWLTRTETASRVRGRIEQILDWAAARNLRQGPNPARWRGHLDKVLPKRSKVARPVHHRALPYTEVPAFMIELKAVEGMGAQALRFAILTAARSGEVRGARWPEIDLGAGTWTVPADRMKAGREHRVALSAAALDLLKTLPRIGGSDLVFPAPRGGVLSDMTLSAVLRRMKVDAVPHGFRSTFRDWVAECTTHGSDVAEMALAHAVGNKVEAAYRRGDLFEKRRRLADDWARFCESPASSEVAILKVRGQ
ncbi:MAG: integrase arm-type DNA-binding domain-containing protein [Alphaproteobacteria bacterium]|nr:integrase arm-type DNA-binding domain-containing protein [Alphaproteobacteria bacterium]MBU2168225.1 integrase arm-type DNA-binding domain-containing protein [Alphaproteobacteria bacterium]